jgi:HNH endonuclease
MGKTSNRFKWTTRQKEEMKSLYASGYSHLDISEHFGCNRETIRYHLKKMGVESRCVGMQTDIAKAKYSRERHHGWKGGRYLNHGYWSILNKEHPQSDNDGYVPEHRYLIEQYLLENDKSHPALENGVLSKDWVVHHINGIKSDNRLENLEPLHKSKHHSWLHYKQDIENLNNEVLRLKDILNRHKISY